MVVRLILRMMLIIGILIIFIIGKIEWLRLLTLTRLGLILQHHGKNGTMAMVKLEVILLIA